MTGSKKQEAGSRKQEAVAVAAVAAVAVVAAVVSGGAFAPPAYMWREEEIEEKTWVSRKHGPRHIRRRPELAESMAPGKEWRREAGGTMNEETTTRRLHYNEE